MILIDFRYRFLSIIMSGCDSINQTFIHCGFSNHFTENVIRWFNESDNDNFTPKIKKFYLGFQHSDTLGTRGFFSRATRSFVDRRLTRTADTSKARGNTSERLDLAC